jgi:hypothetical protein
MRIRGWNGPRIILCACVSYRLMPELYSRFSLDGSEPLLRKQALFRNDCLVEPWSLCQAGLPRSETNAQPSATQVVCAYP